MKRIFPVITILITLSLLGLIYFQVLWLHTARVTKEKQLRENIFLGRRADTTMRPNSRCRLSSKQVRENTQLLAVLLDLLDLLLALPLTSGETCRCKRHSGARITNILVCCCILMYTNIVVYEYISTSTLLIARYTVRKLR